MDDRWWDGEVGEDRVKISTAYVLSDGKVVDAESYGNVVKGAAAGSVSSDEPVEGMIRSFSLGGVDYDIVEPPYPPVNLLSYMQQNEVHAAACKAKVIDSIGRGYSVEPLPELLAQGERLSEEDRKAIADQTREVRAFLRTCNFNKGFSGVFTLAGLDREGVGYGAVEVIRSRDMRVRRIDHIPAFRIKALRGWVGFVESVDVDKYVYYQNFGDKVAVRDVAEPDGARPYDPAIDDIGSARWNLIDRETGKPTRDFARAANEILWLPLLHPSTIYYGLSDVVPAIGSLVANLFLQNYNLQFFENNAIPHYAIIIEGADLSPDVLKLIQAYFKQEIKGNSHGTLVIPVPSQGRQVKVTFQKLASEEREGSFQTLRERNNQAIMTAHQVSPAIIGIADAASLGSGKGRAQSENYRDRVILPRQEFYSDKINRMLHLGLNITHVYLKFNPYNIQDAAEIAEVVCKYLDRGTISINEGRRMGNLGDPIKNGDKHFIKVGKVLVDIEGLSRTQSVITDDSPTKPSPGINEENLKSCPECKPGVAKFYTKDEVDSVVGADYVHKSPACRMDGETVGECVSRKVSEIISERPGINRDQALAIAYSLCRTACSEKGN